jgi:hypothetical protein
MINSFRSAKDRFAALSVLAQMAFLIIACAIGAAVAIWLFNQLFYYLLARSYVEEIATAYDLNENLARAITWASFAAIVVLAGHTLSFSKKRRLIGSSGLIVLLIGHSLIVWNGVRENNFKPDGRSARCYVVTRENIKILNRVGIDPSTGKECRPITPQVVEKVNEYKTGKRPKQISGDDPIFFDPISGEPVIWFAKTDTGRIQIFNLMGFDPKTGEELIPIDRATAQAWKAQNERKITRAPVEMSDPDKYGFFDPLTGAPKVWFWRSETDQYEFYDGPGFQPRTGDSLQSVSREVINAWRQSMTKAAAAKREEQERRDKEAKERSERETKERFDASERDRIAKQASADARQLEQQAALDCDRLAANPTDRNKTAEGVPFDMLKGQAELAFEACTKAGQQYPSELRYQYQLGRASQFKDKKKAFDIFTNLTNLRYAAAFDNLGGMYLYDRKDVATASQLFQTGSKLGDADSMVSLAEMIEKNYFTPPDASNLRLALLKKAGEFGHAGAQRAFAIEYQKAQTAQQQQIMQLQVQQQMLQMFGAAIGGIRR